MRKVASILLPLAPLSACATTSPPPPAAHAVPAVLPTGWRAVATDEDGDRIDTLTTRWTQALAAAQRRHAGTVADEAALLDPAAALDHPGLSPGPYRCRLVRFGGSAEGGTPVFHRYRPFFCHVGGGDAGPPLSFAKQTGSERPGGWLYSDGARRYVFLGTARGGIDAAIPGYGASADQDRIGIVERIGPFRWRLVMIGRDQPAQVDVLELVPIPPPVDDPTLLARR